MPHIKLPHDHGQEIEREFSHMPETCQFGTTAEIFKNLADSSRLRIFWILCHCEECVINLSALVSMSSPAVSHHLKQLKAGGLIVSRRDGKEVYYKAADNEKVQLLHHMIENLVEISCPVPKTGQEPSESCPPGNLPPQTEIIKRIHDQLTGHPDQRITIEELARQYLMNTTTLKNAFKAVYGQPIAAYMKTYRIQEAARLLRETDRGIADIAASAGYKSQAKFTQAFKDILGVPPAEYRRQQS